MQRRLLRPVCTAAASHSLRDQLFRMCPPCRSLTRVLVESYRIVKESGQKFEIVFVSADRTVDEVSESWPSASPAKNVRNARRTSQHCPLLAFKSLQFTVAPTSVDFSSHAQTGTL
ncbi:hypothetical protein INR49_016506 [Caranx melampygus]|nr:hypothetical protein INR49_016506 [Caranx melampygus]